MYAVFYLTSAKGGAAGRGSFRQGEFSGMFLAISVRRGAEELSELPAKVFDVVISAVLRDLADGF